MIPVSGPKPNAQRGRADTVAKEGEGVAICGGFLVLLE